MRSWSKAWKPSEDCTKHRWKERPGFGHRYPKLMTVVKEDLGDRRADTVTLVWMQGESDVARITID